MHNHSLDSDQSYNELGSPLGSPRRKKAPHIFGETFQQILRVLNSSFMFGTLVLPFYIQQLGIILAILVFMLFFAISFVESTLLLDLKYYARSRLQPGKLSSVFILFKLPNYVVNICRGVFVVNANLYVVLLLTVFQKCLYCIIQLYIQHPMMEIYQVITSQRFILLIGTLLLLPFFIKWKYPLCLIAISRITGILAIMTIVIIAACMQKHKTQFSLLYPQPHDFIQIWTTIPCVVLSFSYHRQIFTGYLRTKPLNTEDHDRSVKAGSFYGSFILMLFELVICTLAAYTFYDPNNQTPDNLLVMIYYATTNGNYIRGFTRIYAVPFYFLLAFSALLQIIQYVPSAVVQILNIWKPAPICPKQQKLQMQEIMLVMDNSVNDRDPSSKATSPSKLKQQLMFHDPKKLSNYKHSLIAATGFYIIAFGISMALPPILIIVSLMGSITQNIISFLIPSALYVNKHFKGDSNPFKLCFAWYMILFSITFMLMGLIIGLIALYNGLE